MTCGSNKQIIQKYASTGQTWISLIWRLNSKKSASKSVFLWSKGLYGFFFSAEYMWWNLFEIVSIPSIFDSDKTENVSSAFITSMIYNSKQIGQIKGYYIGPEDNSRYLYLYLYFFLCDERNVNEREQSLLFTGIRFVRCEVWSSTFDLGPDQGWLVLTQG